MDTDSRTPKQLEEELLADSRTPKQLEEELIDHIIELQDFVGVMFPWRIAQNHNEVILNTKTIKDIILFIKKLI